MRSQLRFTPDQARQRYSLSPRCHQLQAGDGAWLYNPQQTEGLTPKLQRPWHGLYTIMRWLNDLVYKKQLGLRTKPKVVHRNRLWTYSGANAPTWFHDTEELPSHTTGTPADGATGYPATNESPG